MRLGELYPEEAELAKRRLEEARASDIPPDMNLNEVAVAIFVNGRLQYHGGETVGVRGGPMTRALMMEAVGHIMTTVDFEGNVAEEEEAQHG